jgi:hypothetical protein
MFIIETETLVIIAVLILLLLASIAIARFTVRVKLRAGLNASNPFSTGKDSLMEHLASPSGSHYPVLMSNRKLINERIPKCCYYLFTKRYPLTVYGVVREDKAKGRLLVRVIYEENIFVDKRRQVSLLWVQEELKVERWDISKVCPTPWDKSNRVKVK